MPASPSRSALMPSGPMTAGLCLLALLLLALALPAGAAGPRLKQAQQLQRLQDNYAAAVRWGEFEKAWALVDPAWREAHPLDDLQLARYQQLQVTGYREVGNGVNPDGSVQRTIELRVVNRHTQAERNVPYRETWHYDASGKRWWLGGGLPDLWAGE